MREKDRRKRRKGGTLGMCLCCSRITGSEAKASLPSWLPPHARRSSNGISKMQCGQACFRFYSSFFSCSLSKAFPSAGHDWNFSPGRSRGSLKVFEPPPLLHFWAPHAVSRHNSGKRMSETCFFFFFKSHLASRWNVNESFFFLLQQANMVVQLVRYWKHV